MIQSKNFRFEIILIAVAFLASCATSPSNSGSTGGTSTAGGSSNASSGPLNFPHDPSGALRATTGRYGTSTGATNPALSAPDMIFPLRHGPAFSNTQVFSVYGGGNAIFRPNEDAPISSPYRDTPAPIPGSEADPSNYTYPWQDNFCEARGWFNGFCPSSGGGRGHQGQDIRPATCERGIHEVVAVGDGEITRVTPKTIELHETGTGRIFIYLHTDRPLRPDIYRGKLVRAGDVIGTVSDVDGGTMTNPTHGTTIHLHFEIWDGHITGATQGGVGLLPPYTSLVEAYRRLLGNAPHELNPVSQPPVSGSC